MLKEHIPDSGLKIDFLLNITQEVINAFSHLFLSPYVFSNLMRAKSIVLCKWLGNPKISNEKNVIFVCL